jgi:hypothetical protein
VTWIMVDMHRATMLAKVSRSCILAGCVVEAASCEIIDESSVLFEGRTGRIVKNKSLEV